MKRLLFICLLLAALAGCVTQTDEKLVCLNQSLEIQTKEMPNVIAQANAGDARAARRLSDYYDYCTARRDLALLWLVKAASLGDRIAQFNLGTTLWHEPKDESSRTEAVGWLQKSAAQGYISAIEMLKEIKMKPNKAPLPTAMSVTPRADARVAPATAAAEL